jgi:hypothetical protein
MKGAAVEDSLEYAGDRKQLLAANKSESFCNPKESHGPKT